MSRSHLAQPSLTCSGGKGNQGGLPKEVGKKEERTYICSSLFTPRVTKLLALTKAKPHTRRQGFIGGCALLR